jgi:hypothetical protein
VTVVLILLYRMSRTRFSIYKNHTRQMWASAGHGQGADEDPGQAGAGSAGHDFRLLAGQSHEIGIVPIGLKILVLAGHPFVVLRFVIDGLFERG